MRRRSLRARHLRAGDAKRVSRRRALHRLAVSGQGQATVHCWAAPVYASLHPAGAHGSRAFVVAIGWVRGRSVGIGTLLYGVAIGPLIQLLLPAFVVVLPPPKATETGR